MMKKALLSIALLFASMPALCQNTTTVSGSNIMDLNGAKLANGQICFLGTDQTDTPISFQTGGGGQVLKRQFCSTVTVGVISSFTVPNPANTLPSGIYYRVMVKDGATGLEVLRYTLVTFTGATFNFDNYTPNPPGFVPAPLSGTSVTGNLGVTGNISATGTLTGSNLPGTIPGTGSCTNQFVTALNTAAPPTCANSLGGELTTAAYNVSTHGDRRSYIQNSDFEGSSVLPPPGWILTNGTASYETTSPAPGKVQSLKLATTSQFGNIRTSTNFSAAAGDTYTLTCSAKSDGTGTAVCGLFCFNSSNTNIAQILTPQTTSTTWTTLSVNATIPANTDYCRVAAENSSATQPSTVWFDLFGIQLTSFSGPLKATNFQGPEAAAPAGIASSDVLYPDSTAHRWKMINNNGAADTVAGLADFASPPAIGATTPNTGAFSTLTASGTITATGTIASTSANGWTVGAISNAPRVIFNSGNAGFAYEFINASNAIEGLQILGADAFESGGPATGGAAGHAALWADSTSHFWKAKNNAGTTYNLVGDATTQTLTNKTLTSPNITAPTVTSPVINTGVSQGSGFKHQRFGATCTTTANNLATCFTTYSWATAFADANYTPVCTGVGPSNGTAFFNIQSWTSTGITIILTSNGLASTFAGVDCIAIHD